MDILQGSPHVIVAKVSGETENIIVFWRRQS